MSRGPRGSKDLQVPLYKSLVYLTLYYIVIVSYLSLRNRLSLIYYTVYINTIFIPYTFNINELSSAGPLGEAKLGDPGSKGDDGKSGPQGISGTPGQPGEMGPPGLCDNSGGCNRAPQQTG